MLDIPGYRVLGTIRATGSNVLFHAVREADGLPVIIKTPMAPSPGPRERERYRREFGILQRLRDVRGVTRPYACERIHERPVLLLEQVQGEALSESVGQPMEATRFLTLAISLASTLAEVHRRNVIHKDIKPSNIILEPSGRGAAHRLRQSPRCSRWSTWTRRPATWSRGRWRTCPRSRRGG